MNALAKLHDRFLNTCAETVEKIDDAIVAMLDAKTRSTGIVEDAIDEAIDILQTARYSILIDRNEVRDIVDVVGDEVVPAAAEVRQ